MKYLKLFDTHSAYNTYITGQDKVLPNVSFCEDNNDVHFNPWVETKVVATFNVTSTSSPTLICDSETLSQVSEIYIDNVRQSTVISEYTFETTGEHIVKYTLSDPTIVGFFYNCANLTSIMIPNSVTTIDSAAFTNCSGLTSVTIPNSVTTIGNYAFQSCSNLTSVVIGNNVTTINQYAFRNCPSLTSIIIPDSVTTIGQKAFSSCTSLTNIVIPNSVTTIEQKTFSDCYNLTNITIGSGVTSIGDMAFFQDTSLSTITSLATTAPTILSSTFQDLSSLHSGTLYVPSGSTGYDTWMGTGNYYLGKYNWTKVEQ